MELRPFLRSASLTALAALLLSLATLVQAAPLTQTTSAWTGAYYANRNLQGDPVLVRNDPTIDFSWGSKSPDPTLPADDFSVRWQRWLWIDTPGKWTFTVVTDDGVRLYIDDSLVIDAWNDQQATARTATINLTQAYHLVKMEYFDHSGNAEAHLYMISAAYPDWRGEYYANTDLSGTPTFVRNDSTLNFNFGTAGPGGGVSGANFSARWTRSYSFAAGRYRFTATTDDGVRLSVDRQILIDQWKDQTAKSWTGEITLTAGYHLLQMEYYNRGGSATASLSWVPISGGGEIWRGDYFDNTGLQGASDLSQDYTDLNFEWGTKPPGGKVTSPNNWSARFVSKRTVSVPGLYTVTASGDDGFRVWVDGNLLFDEWHDQPPTPYGATIYLNAGTHDWRIEYYQHTGTASFHLQIIQGVYYPTSPTSGDVTVEEGTSGFFKGGAAESWREQAAGSGNHALWLQNNVFSQTSQSWARWYPRLSSAGMYEVAAFIPPNLGTTRNARYWISHSGTSTMQSIDQSLYSNQWVSLGTYYFDASGSEYVMLADTTYEPAQSTVIAVDAVKFSPR